MYCCVPRQQTTIVFVISYTFNSAPEMNNIFSHDGNAPVSMWSCDASSGMNTAMRSCMLSRCCPLACAYCLCPCSAGGQLWLFQCEPCHGILGGQHRRWHCTHLRRADRERGKPQHRRVQHRRWKLRHVCPHRPDAHSDWHDRSVREFSLHPGSYAGSVLDGKLVPGSCHPDNNHNSCHSVCRRACGPLVLWLDTGRLPMQNSIFPPVLCVQ